VTTRGQLEASIVERLARLSDTDMQRVAEDYARIRFPKRFPRFDFRAVSEEGKSRPGWPDAWVDLGGEIDGVEATGSKTKSSVLRHLEEDIKKARTRSPKLAGLLLVSGHPGVQPKENELEAWRQRFVTEAGLAPDRVHLVFGAGLVRELVQPEFARTRIEVLGLEYAPSHFKLVRAKRGPDESRIDSALVPSEQDYEAGRVHRPVLADQVLARLHRHRCSLVRGVGASGKSVLAWLLALEVAEQRRPAYLLDLADYVDASPDTASALIDDLYRFGHPDALFILDNCHLEESLAKEVVLAWQELAPGEQPRLLLLGRELHTSRGSLIDGLHIEPLTLTARQPEVRGIYMRLARRRMGSHPPPEPPPEVLDRWVRTFGGNPSSLDTTTDLIAFSAAAWRRMHDLLDGRWALSEADAIHEVRSVYLDKLSEAETQNLMQLCAVQELDLPIDEAALANPGAGFHKSSRRLGLVFHQTAGADGQYVHYRLAHSALGRLILRASHFDLDPAAERVAVARNHPYFGVSIFGRLLTLSRVAEARALATDMLARPNFVLELGGLQRVDWFVRGVERVGLILPSLVALVASESARRALADRALQTPLDSLANFLGYAARTTELKPVFTALTADLALPVNRQTLAERALQTPLDSLANFLGYAARTTELKLVFTALSADLALPVSRQTLAKRALQTSLNSLANFLDYAARTTELKPVFTALTADLALPANRQTLAERALQTPWNFLANFLGYAARTTELTPVFTALIADLALPVNRQTLAVRALQSSLGGLANFLDYAARMAELIPVFTALTADLALPVNRQALAERALQTPLDTLANFLGYAARTKELKPVFIALTADLALPVNRRTLTERALQTSLGGLANFFEYAARTTELKPVFTALTADLALPANHQTLAERALQTSLGSLSNFFDYAALTTELKPVLTALIADLALPANRQTLAERALQTPLDGLANFLVYAARTMELKRVFIALTADLTLPVNRQSLAERALQTSLGGLANFFEYAALTTALKPVLTALIADLALPANRQTLAERALQTPLDGLANFLVYAARTTELKPVFIALTADLALPVNRQTLAERALQTPLDGLANFLGYAARTTELKPVFTALTSDLSLPDRRHRITRSLETAPLDSVVAVLRLEDESGSWAAAFAIVDSVRWGDARRKEALPKIDPFVAFQRIAAKLGRPELCEIPALRLAVESSPEEWHRPGIGLHHFSHVLRLARGASPAELDRFLDRVATPDWLDGQMEYATAGGLAGSLLSLVTNLQPAQLTRFHRVALVRRVVHELSWQESPKAESLVAALSLLGALRAIGLTSPAWEARWAGAGELAKALNQRAPDPDRTTIGPLQIQLWLGLREMAQWRDDVVAVPPNLADRILELWQATERYEAGVLPPPVRALNAGMIAWLKRCRAAGWRLVPPEGGSTEGDQPTLI